MFENCSSLQQCIDERNDRSRGTRVPHNMRGTAPGGENGTRRENGPQEEEDRDRSEHRCRLVGVDAYRAAHLGPLVQQGEEIHGPVAQEGHA